MPKYDPDRLPPELSPIHWIRFFTGSKYIALLYDEKGSPLWAAHRTGHKHQDILEALTNSPAHRFYKLPVENDLNALFEHCRKSAGRDLFLGPVDKLPPEKLSPELFPRFFSKNLVEEKTIAPYIVITHPMTVLLLARLGPARFLGIVTFEIVLEQIMRAENQTSVFADDSGRIIGLNSLFASVFGLENPRSVLGKKLENYISFSRPPFELPVKKTRTMAAADTWQWTDRTGPFMPGVPPGTVVPESRGLRCENSGDRGSIHLAWRKPLPFDHHDFCIEMEFVPLNKRIPTLIVRGTRQEDLYTADIVGYSFGALVQSQFEVKKAGDRLRTFALPDLDPDRPYKLTVTRQEKYFSAVLDGKALGAWEETAPFMMKSDDIFYLLLRPGERFVLKSMRLAHAPAEQRPRAAVPLRAAANRSGRTALFNVSCFQGVMRNTNYTLFMLEDITDLKTSIDTLTRERDRLSELVRHEKSFVGESLVMTEIRSSLPTVADSDMAVLLEGETGTGKEVVAQSVHQMSQRRNRPFVKIDCSAIPRELIESELFGHEKGAFTGAHAAHAGKFEQAQGGTVYLDEVENLPVAVQAKLLNVLEDRKIVRVGGTRAVRLDIRLIAASNQPLKKQMDEGAFRPDLFYRLNQFRIELPPLRQRREDIPLLAAHFVREANRIYKKTVQGFDDPALEKLYQAPWPGNVRELRNVIFRAILFCKGQRIDPDDIILDERAGPARPVYRPARRRGGYQKKCVLTRENVGAALKSHNGVVARAAAALDISRMMTYNLIQRFNIDLDEYRKG
jgi:two-component system response regulator AtoC